jgi:hypothetical protein
MYWNDRQARCTLLVFLLIFTAGQLKSYLLGPVYPESAQHHENWPPDGFIVDATVLKNRALVIFPRGTELGIAIASLGLEPDFQGAGFCLPRGGVLYLGQKGWRIRSMNQRERWVWRIPMDLYQCAPRDLQRISGIGPSLAGKIHEYVENRGYLISLSDLEEVPGVGPGKLKVLKRELEIP